MNEPNVLNLDELKVQKTFILKGRNRTIRSMNVGEFIDSASIDESLKSESAQEQIKKLAEFIAPYLNDTTAEELRELELPQLFALLSFARGDDIAEKEGNPPTATA